MNKRSDTIEKITAPILSDPNGKIIIWGAEASTLYGFTSEEITGLPLSFLQNSKLPKVIVEKFSPEIDRLCYCEERRHSSGATVKVECRKDLQYSSQGKTDYQLEYSWLVLEPETKVSSRVNEKNAHAMTQIMLAYSIASHGRILWCNLPAQEVVPPLSGKSPLSLSIKELLDEFEAPPEQIGKVVLAIADNEPIHLLMNWRLSPMQSVIMEVAGTPVTRSNHSEQETYMLAATNVSGRIAIEEQFLESEQRYRSIVRAMSEGIVVQNDGGHITAFNKAALRILGLTEDQLLGRTSHTPEWRSIQADGSPLPGEMHPAMQTLASGKPIYNFLMGVHLPCGEIRWISINSSPIFKESDSKPSSVVTTFRDITVEKESVALLAKREEFYRVLLDTSYDIIAVHDTEGKIIAASKAIELLLGVEPKQLEQQSLSLLLHPDDIESLKQEKLPLALSGETVTALFRLRKADGSYIWAESIIRSFIQEEEGIRLLSVTRDITKQKEYEEQIKYNEELFRLILDSTYDMITLHNEQGEYIYVPQSVKAVLGWEPDYLLGQSPLDFVLPHEAEEALQSAMPMLSAGNTFQQIVHFRSKDGSYLLLETLARTIEQGDKKLILSTARDITKQHEAEEKLKQREELYRIILDTTNDLIWLHSIDAVIIYAPRSSEAILGYKPEELIGKTPFVIIHPEDQDKARNYAHATVAQGEEICAKLRFLHKDGNYIWCETMARLYSEPGQEPLIISATRNIDSQERLAQQLRNSEELHRLVFNAGNDLFIVHEQDGSYFLVSESVGRILDYTPEQLIGESPFDFLHPEDLHLSRGAFRRLLEQGEVHITHRLRHRRGYYIWVESHSRMFQQEGQPRRIFTVARDITKQRRLEEERQKLQDDLFDTLRNTSGQVYKYRRYTDGEFYLVFSEGLLAEELGITTAKFAGKTLHQIVPDTAPEIEEYYKRAAKGESVEFQVESEGRWFLTTLQPIRSKGIVTDIVGSAVDITRRIEAERELQEEKITSMYAVAQTQEEERSRIASELHDGVGHLLSVVKMRISTLFQDESSLSQEHKTYIEETTRLLDNAIKEMRAISHQLMSYTLDSLGIGAAIEDLLYNIKSANTLAVHSNIRLNSPAALSRQQQIILYRIVQEILHNALKHSGASEITIDLVEHDDVIVLIAEDNGKGFDVQNAKRGIGLNSISNRVALLAGVLDIDSTPGQGTSITIEIPLKRQSN